LVKRAVTMPPVPGARKLGRRRTNFAESKSDSLARLSGLVLSVEVPHMMPSSRRLAWPFGDRGYYWWLCNRNTLACQFVHLPCRSLAPIAIRLRLRMPKASQYFSRRPIGTRTICAQPLLEFFASMEW